MAYQILALDLDGTLTNSQKEITKPTLDALIEIQEAGKKVVLASGRPTKGVVPLAEQLHLCLSASFGWLSSSGTYLVRMPMKLILTMPPTMITIKPKLSKL